MLGIASCSPADKRLVDTVETLESQHVSIDEAFAIKLYEEEPAESLADVLAQFPGIYVGRQGNDARVLVRGCPTVFQVNGLRSYFTYLEANSFVDASTISHIDIRRGRRNPSYVTGPVIHIFTKRKVSPAEPSR